MAAASAARHRELSPTVAAYWATVTAASDPPGSPAAGRRATPMTEGLPHELPPTVSAYQTTETREEA